MIDRRKFIAAAVAACASSARGETPRSAFGPQSTAEQVTAGLDLKGMTAILHNVPATSIAHQAKSPAQGAATQCYVATYPLLAKASGEYFKDCNPAPQSDCQRDAAMAARLWEISTQLTAR